MIFQTEAEGAAKYSVRCAISPCQEHWALDALVANNIILQRDTTEIVHSVFQLTS